MNENKNWLVAASPLLVDSKNAEFLTCYFGSRNKIITDAHIPFHPLVLPIILSSSIAVVVVHWGFASRFDVAVAFDVAVVSCVVVSDVVHSHECRFVFFFFLDNTYESENGNIIQNIALVFWD